MLNALSKILPKALRKKIREKTLASVETLPTEPTRFHLRYSNPSFSLHQNSFFIFNTQIMNCVKAVELTGNLIVPLKISNEFFHCSTPRYTCRVQLLDESYILFDIKVSLF